MTTSPAYRACVTALERLLSPRVASRTLHMAMREQGLTAETVTPDELEPILKGPVFKQLQVAMPAARARDAVSDILGKLAASSDEPRVADAEPSADHAPDAGHEPPANASDRGIAEQASASGDGAATPPDAPSTQPQHAPAALERLRAALRPFNLYFEWPEVRRARALLARIDDEATSAGEVPSLITDAEAALETVRQKLEDRLVLQAQDLVRLEEELEEVSSLGGAKARRLAALVNRVREAQADRQLADAEIERGSALARELRKLVASSVYQDGTDEGGPDLEARIRALDAAGEVEELDRLARDRAVLLEHRGDLAERLREMREQVTAGITLGDDLKALRETFDTARAQRVREVSRELSEAAARLDEHGDAWTDELRREHDVLTGIVLENGLPPMADLVRFHDRATLALDRAASEDRHAEADAEAERARLDVQGERLERGRHELLRYGDESDDPGVERLRNAVDALRIAQAEERLDPDADAELRAASAALADRRSDERDSEGAARAQLAALLARLDGLPASIDPEGTAELRTELEQRLDAPPNDQELATIAAAVAEAVAAAKQSARQALDRLGSEAGQWSLANLLDAVRDANEQLEDAREPDLAGLERRLESAIQDARTRQLDQLHELERSAARLTGIDPAVEVALSEALTRARASVAEGEPAITIGDATDQVARLEEILEQRVGGVVPRLDTALATLRTVERLNSDDVATVRRILHHLDSQRDAFARVSPALRARMERSLQEAEDLLGKLVEDERATRAIADQLMSGHRFDDVLGLFGPENDTAPDDTSDRADSSFDDAADAWLEHHHQRSDIEASGLRSERTGAVRSRGMSDDATRDWAPRSKELLDQLTALGTALDLGGPRVVTLERSRGCLLIGHDPAGTALIASRDTGSLGLLARDLRERDWRTAVGTLGPDDDASTPPAHDPENDDAHDPD
ncbi:MAG: hypothetical protein U5J97_09615 [Trueperaceae bacterium]|nr:hypothetical protein [Trueperaceae bacterium]